jgi:hypothetical protein
LQEHARKCYPVSLYLSNEIYGCLASPKQVWADSDRSIPSEVTRPGAVTESAGLPLVPTPRALEELLSAPIPGSFDTIAESTTPRLGASATHEFEGSVPLAIEGLCAAPVAFDCPFELSEIGGTMDLEPTLQDVGRMSSPNLPTSQAVGATPLHVKELDTPGETIDRHPYSLPELSCPNEYESLILPDEHSVTDDTLLLRTPYIINTKYMAIICTQCKHAVAPDNASTHAHQFHPSCKVPGSFVVELTNKYPGLKSEKIHPGGVVQPIFGLALPMAQYLVCARCLRGYSNHASLRNHVCDNPQKDLEGRPPKFSSLVQTFFRGPRLCYFPITTPTSKAEEGCVDDFALFQSQYPQVDVIEDEIAGPADYRELDQFLYKEGWISHVTGYSRSELSTLTCLPQQDEALAPIKHEVFLLMSRIQLVIGSAGFHVRRLLGRRPS